MDQQLHVFITVADKGSFSRAAEELHMTQPAVSQYIQTLERMMGERLLERNNKYVRLNKAGEIVYYHAKEILGLYVKMQDLVDDLKHTAKGMLKIGASYTYGEYILPHIIAHLQELYPLIKPTITIGNTKEIIELVLNHQLDVGVIEGECPPGKLNVELLAEDTMVPVVSTKHRLAKKATVTAAELNEETWIVREVGSGTREATNNMFHTMQLNPENIMEFGSTQIIKESVEAGLGISFLSYWAIRKELALGTLQVLKLAGAQFTRPFSVITVSTPFKMKTLEVFVEILRGEEALAWYHHSLNDI